VKITAGDDTTPAVYNFTFTGDSLTGNYEFNGMKGRIRGVRRKVDHEHIMNDDVKVIVRRLRLRPLHALSIVGTLAIGLGGALAVIGIAGPTLFQPLPYPNPDRLVAVTSKLPIPTLPEMGFADVGYRRMVSDNARSPASRRIRPGV